MSNYIIFEQPLNETIRLCLTLEQLFQQADESIQFATTIYQTHSAMNTIIKLIHIIDRPDLKGKLSKALAHHASQLTQLEHNPQVCQETLAQTLSEVDTLADAMHENTIKIAQDIKDHPILRSVLQYSTTPSGPILFNLPAYNLWLHEDNATKQANMLDWMRRFALTKKCCQTLLRLTRYSANFITAQALDGFYQQNLQSPPVTQLVRVKLTKDTDCWPEISVGRHRLAIYFIHAKKADKPNLTFELACCY